jgi:hypothetical protein
MLKTDCGSFGNESGGGVYGADEGFCVLVKRRFYEATAAETAKSATPPRGSQIGA